MDILDAERALNNVVTRELTRYYLFRREIYVSVFTLKNIVFVLEHLSQVKICLRFNTKTSNVASARIQCMLTELLLLCKEDLVKFSLSLRPYICYM